MTAIVKLERNFDSGIIISRWGRFSERATSAIREAILNYLRVYGLEAVKRYFPKGGTGKLENSLKVFDMSEGYRIMFRIASDDPEMDAVIRILEYGSPPHEITPRQAEALRFQPEAMRFFKGPTAGPRPLPSKILLDYVYAKSVQHPGNQAYRMFQNGLAEIKPELIRVANEALKETTLEIMREK